MRHPLQEPLFPRKVSGGRADTGRTRFLFRDTLGRSGPQGRQQFVPHLAHQPNRRRDGNVGDEVRGVLQTQTILHQTVLPPLGHDCFEHLLVTLHS